jgi:diguanylate cyclase (GGDEF)-like protein
MRRTETSSQRPSHFNSTRLFYTALISAGVVIVLFTVLSAFWFEQQSHKLQRQGQERAATLMAEGLAHAVENDLITRDFGSLEARLIQTASNEQVLAVLLADNRGKVLSHVRRRTIGEAAEPLFMPSSITPPSHTPVLEIDGKQLRLWIRMGSAMPMGWLRIELVASSSDAALGLLQNQLLLLSVASGLALITVLVLVLRKTHDLFQEREAVLLKTQQQLEKAAYHDSLTRLPNRHLLMDRLRLAMTSSLRHARPLALCFIDLDGFKRINDDHGHEAGDYLLIEVARRLQAGVRQHDTVARLGGDEFVLLLPELEHGPEIEAVLGRLLRSVTEPVLYGTRRLQVGMSIGIALHPDHARDCDSLIEKADQAMYLAKRGGKNRWVFYEG